MQDLNGPIEELEKTRRELDQVTKTMLSVEEDRDLWKETIWRLLQEAGSGNRTLEAKI